MKRRASIQAEFMKELEAPISTPTKAFTSKTGSDEDAILVESPAVTEKGSVRKKKGRK